MAADIARELAGAGWLTATTADALGPGNPAVLVLDATEVRAGAAAMARIRQSAPGAPALFLGTRETVEDVLAGVTGPGDDYLTVPFTPGIWCCACAGSPATPTPRTRTPHSPSGTRPCGPDGSWPGRATTRSR